MIALIQRVVHASVVIGDETAGDIGPGLLALIGVEKNDNDPIVSRMAEKLLRYRIFADSDERMNLSVMQSGGEVMLVPQFTLAADTSSGLRPGFNGAPPQQARGLFDALAAEVARAYEPPALGRFGVDMQVTLCNDGPVTFWLQVS